MEVEVSPNKSEVKKKKKANEKPSLLQLQRFEFAELNILHKGNAAKTLGMVRRAIQMGYDSVIINIDVGDLNPQAKVDEVEEPPTKKKKKAKKSGEQTNQQQFDTLPEPFLVDESKLDLSQIEANGKKFRQFSRLTVTLTDTTSVHKLQIHPNRPLFDIVAIRCLDEAMLSTMSRKGDLFDIITMDSRQPNNRIPWIHKQKLIQACIKEGISFEVCYGEALNDNEIRRQFFINGRALVRMSNKGRGIVLSCGVESLALLRGPYDVANMCTLFGMPSRKGNKLVSDNCCQLLLRSQSRRTIKGAIHIAPIEKAPAPSNISREDHLAALSAIPEFREQMKPRIEIVETT